MTTEQLLIALLRAVLRDEPFPKEIAFSEGKAVYQSARKHDLAHVISKLLVDCLPKPETDAEHAFLRRIDELTEIAEYRYAKLDAEFEHVGSVFERAAIPYMPLKGAVMRVLYPKPWMRTSCDIDVLVHEEDLDRASAALVSEGFTTNGIRNYHDMVFSCDGIQLELHHNLFERVPAMDAVLATVWEHTVSKGYRYVQTPAFFCFHLVAHMAYHFMHGGCGVRPLIDLWLLRESGRVEEETAVRELCENAALLTFYEHVCRLSDVWFGNAAHDEATKSIEDFILRGGLFGSKEQRSASNAARHGRTGFLLNTVFMPYQDLKRIYPALDGKPFLTPYYQMCRLINKLSNKRGKRAFQRAVDTYRHSQDEVDAVSELLSMLELQEV